MTSHRHALRTLVATLALTATASLTGCAADAEPAATGSRAPAASTSATAPTTTTPSISRAAPACRGIVKTFDTSRGYGYITEAATGQHLFVHQSGLSDRVRMGDTVNFQVETSSKGPTAINVRLCY